MAPHSDNQPDSPHAMACMEIWGGNRATHRTVTLPGLDAWVYSKPYMQADGGGDVYYVSNCATGRITRLMLADVSGHGSSVATIANELRNLMRRYVNHIQQVKFVTSMNDALANLAHSGGFATAVVATFLAPTRRLTFSNAGHPIPLVYTARDGLWRLLEIPTEVAQQIDGVSDLPLGIYENGTYAEVDLQLELGDLILFYTDAFIESLLPSGEFIGSHAFLDLVADLDDGRPDTLLDRIVTKTTSLHEGNLTNDDVTLLLFRATGEETQVPLKKRLLAPFRLLTGMATSLLRGGRGIPLPEFSVANLGVGKIKPLSQTSKRKTV